VPVEMPWLDESMLSVAPLDGKETSKPRKAVWLNPSTGIVARRCMNQCKLGSQPRDDSNWTRSRELIIETAKPAKLLLPLTPSPTKRRRCHLRLRRNRSKVFTVAQVVNVLRERGAMDYTIVVAASQRLSYAPGWLPIWCLPAEYFMYKGRATLVIYDDLSKHARLSPNVVAAASARSGSLSRRCVLPDCWNEQRS